MAEPKSKDHISWRQVYKLDDLNNPNNDYPFHKWPERMQQFFEDTMQVYENTQAGQDYMRQLQAKHGTINVVGTLTYMVGDKKLPGTGFGVPRSGEDMVVVMQNFRKYYVDGDYKGFAETFRGIPLERLQSRGERVKLAAAIVGHEVGHQLNLPDDLAKRMNKPFEAGVVCGEKVSVDNYEERIRAELGLPPRKHYIDGSQALGALVKSFQEAYYDLDKEDFGFLKRRLEGKPVDPEYTGEYKADMGLLTGELKKRARHIVKQNIFACTDVSPTEISRTVSGLLTGFIKEQAAKAPEAKKDGGAER